jgi:hypothetical protein
MRKLRNLTFTYLLKLWFSALFICFTFSFSNAQSINQNAPTPVITNEISGAILVRDIGDSRLTNYFYTFNGNQGDVFINVVTKNLDGDIDVFTVDGLKPLTKITVFSDNSDSETGRIVYLRKFEKLLLRIQGRSPNDDAATFKIKFAGSFQPLQNTSEAEATKFPELNTINQGEFRVNSVGTIIGTVQKPTPEPKSVAESETKVTEPKSENSSNKEINVKSVDETNVAENSTKIEIRKGNQEEIPEKSEVETPKISKSVEIISEDSIPTETKTNDEIANVTQTEPTQNSGNEIKESKPEKTTPIESKNESASKVVRPLKIEELQKIKLVIQFKDGKIIKEPMSKVFSFNVNQGILTIVMYDGNISRYSLLEIEKISMEGN